MTAKTEHKKTVVVAMSGGVDSSVAALLLQQQGYQVIGITMKLWDYEIVGGNINHESGCCSLDSINDARMVCAKLGIPHYVVNFSKEFHETVVENFISEYLKGHTPNPCVLCNTKIKWDLFIERALELGAEYIATGHYARIRYNQQTGRYELWRGVDHSKDQSYALWGIKQSALKRTIFPLGELKKSEVRRIAAEHGLRTANKSESQEICFVPDNDYRRLLKELRPAEIEKLKGGPLVTLNGKVVGQHNGYPFYTVGQRRGLGGGFAQPMYVVTTDPEKNKVVIGTKDQLLAKEFTVHSVNLISLPRMNEAVRAIIKIRYNDSGKPGTVYPEGENRLRVIFDEPQRAITPGQSMVFYRGDQVLGGGIIEKVIE